MQVISDIEQTRELCQNWRGRGESISFVPTMGCLHAGHLSLIEKAQSIAEHVVVSIFVNPLQFDKQDDFNNYPITFEEDLLKLAKVNVDLVFSPDASAFYPVGYQKVEQSDLGQITTLLEGAYRPGHFLGVATVVKRLFDLIQPHTAIFGKKDFQQLRVIQKLVETFSLEIDIIAMPILREKDGLAMSSRNRRLSKEERQLAPEIFRQIESVKIAICGGATHFVELEQKVSHYLTALGFTPEYVAVCESRTLLPAQAHDKLKVILVAAKLGKVRLIDNILV